MWSLYELYENTMFVMPCGISDFYARNVKTLVKLCVCKHHYWIDRLWNILKLLWNISLVTLICSLFCDRMKILVNQESMFLIYSNLDVFYNSNVPMAQPGNNKRKADKQMLRCARWKHSVVYTIISEVTDHHVCHLLSVTWASPTSTGDGIPGALLEPPWLGMDWIWILWWFDVYIHLENDTHSSFLFSPWNESKKGSNMLLMCNKWWIAKMPCNISNEVKPACVNLNLSVALIASCIWRAGA